MNATELFEALHTTSEELVNIISSTSEENLNKAPFENGWTAAQVVDHVTRSYEGMGEAIGIQGKISDRKTDEKANEFKNILLDMEKKMKSPLFILPTQDAYEKNLLLNKFNNAVTKFTATAKEANLSEQLNLEQLGQLTKLEVLYFILYHTQRHIHQLKNILKTLNN